MLKSHRIGEDIIRELGFSIVERGHGKHHWWIVESPQGLQYKMPIPHNTTEHRFWLNWKSQLRRMVNDERTTTQHSHSHQQLRAARPR